MSAQHDAWKRMVDQSAKEQRGTEPTPQPLHQGLKGDPLEAWRRAIAPPTKV